MEREYDIIVIGGGASGLAAAAAVAQSDPDRRLRTAVVERTNNPGKKLLATGNGRCNLYNMNIAPERYESENREALCRGVEAVIRADQLSFWRRMGMLTTRQEELVYPACYQASAVAELLMAEARQGGVEFLTGQTVVRIGSGRRFRLTTDGGESLFAKQVILAAGGMAAPKLGGNDSGYALARQLGHSVTELTPGLVPVRCVNPSKTMKGVRTRCLVSLYQGEELVERRSGEVQFTEYGVSGIVMMQLSNHMAPGKGYTLELDLLPELDGETLTAFLTEKRNRHPMQQAEYLLIGVIKSQMAELLLRSCRIDHKKRKIGTVTDEELAQLVQRIKSWKLRTEGTLGWEHAQATRGGVRLEEVEMDSFASRLQPGMYLTGEVLDAAGDCGGFNLAWAFGSGILAGRHAAAQLLRE